MCSDYRSLFVGMDVRVPVLDGRLVPYTSLDNAASTPALKHVTQTVQNFMEFYSSVHRGTGFKSQVSTHAYEAARQTVMRFVGANPAEHVCIFGKNTTEAANKLAHRFPFTDQRDVVFVSSMEHHSNDLPWRAAARVVHIRLHADGSLDEADFDAKLAQYANRLALVSITGASNVTGFINPVHRLAEKVHAVGAQIAVDCAQLAPHRRVNMLSLDDPAHFDYVFISAHKMYAPYGCGALIGRRDTFDQGEPDMRGGGEVEIVTLDSVTWSRAPERDEAGSPNTVGAVALAAAIAQLEAVGMDVVAAHEADLTAYALEKFNAMPEIHLLGCPDATQAADRLGVLPLNLEGYSHYLLAAILGFEFGIGVRNGCFCAHPYVLHLMQVQEEEARRVRQEMHAGDRRQVPGLVRVSFGLYNRFEDVDVLLDAFQQIVRKEYRGEYRQDQASGEFFPQGWNVKYEDYFTFEVKK